MRNLQQIVLTAAWVIGSLGLQLAEVQAGELHFAAKAGDIAKVESILLQGGSVDERDKSELTPLMLAVANSHFEVVRILLAQGADIKATNKVGTTVLMYAAGGDEPKATAAICQLLLEKHSGNINAQNNIGHTALMSAATNGNDQVAALLLLKGANAMTRDKDGKTALDHSNAVAFALENQTEEQRNLRRKLGKLLFKTNVQAVALHDAAKAGDVDRVKAVLTKGVGVDERNELGRTPLMIAATQGHLEVVRLLLTKGADAKMFSNDGTSVLMSASFFRKKHESATANMALLLERGADANTTDRSGTTPLMVVAGNGNTGGIALLLDHGADINSQERTGETAGGTALIHAAGRGKGEAVKLLLQRGADATLRDKGGRSALDVARSTPAEGDSAETIKGRKEVAAILGK